MVIHTESGPAAGVELMEFTAARGTAMLARVAESIQQITQAAQVLILHHLPQPQLMEVLTVAGRSGPEPGERMAPPHPSPPRRLVLPLIIDGVLLGSIAVDGVLVPIPPAAQRELSLLAMTGALALQNHLLLLDSDRRAHQHARLHFELLSGTTYHLKNTIAVASEYMELLDLHGELTDQQREYIASSRRSIATGLRLLTELHELGRTDAGALVPAAEPLDVGILIRDMLRSHRLAAGTSGVQFALELRPLPLLRTDPDCVRQILENLISNAVRYSPANGRVTIRAEVQPGRRATDPQQWLRIDVSDAGPGVAEGDAVFEELQRVGRKGPPGFRLAISRRLARLLGGELTLETAAGQGSTFSLWLPLASGTQPAARRV